MELGSPCLERVAALWWHNYLNTTLKQGCTPKERILPQRLTGYGGLGSREKRVWRHWWWETCTGGEFIVETLTGKPDHEQPCNCISQWLNKIKIKRIFFQIFWCVAIFTDNPVAGHQIGWHISRSHQSRLTKPLTECLTHNNILVIPHLGS